MIEWNSDWSSKHTKEEWVGWSESKRSEANRVYCTAAIIITILWVKIKNIESMYGRRASLPVVEWCVTLFYDATSKQKTKENMLFLESLTLFFGTNSQAHTRCENNLMQKSNNMNEHRFLNECIERIEHYYNKDSSIFIGSYSYGKSAHTTRSCSYLSFKRFYEYRLQLWLINST